MKQMPKRIFRTISIVLSLAIVVVAAVVIGTIAAPNQNNKIDIGTADIVWWIKSNSFRPEMTNIVETASEGPSRIVDGNLATSYRPPAGGGSMIIDLGAVYNITDISYDLIANAVGLAVNSVKNQVKVYAAATQAELPTNEFWDANNIPETQYSIAGTSLSDLNNTSGTHKDIEPTIDASKAQGVRYIELAHNTSNLSIAELRVYGDKVGGDPTDGRIRISTDNIPTDRGSDISSSLALDTKISTTFKPAQGKYVVIDLLGYYDITSLNGIVLDNKGATYKIEAGYTAEALSSIGTWNATGVVGPGESGAFGTTFAGRRNWGVKASFDAKNVRFVKITNTSTTISHISEIAIYGKINTALKKYTINVDYKDGKTPIQTMQMYQDANLSKIVNVQPIVPGKEFAGWFYKNAANQEIQLTASSTVVSDMNIYAKYLDSIKLTTSNIISANAGLAGIDRLFDGNTAVGGDYYQWADNTVKMDLGAYYKEATIKIYISAITPCDTFVKYGSERETMTDGGMVISTNSPPGWYTFTAPVNTRYIEVYKTNSGSSKWNEFVACGTFVRNPSVFNLNFNTNGGSALGGISITEDGTYKLPVDPVKAGWRFDGWFTEGALINRFTGTEKITRDMNLYARWVDANTKIMYDLTFDSMGGSAATKISVAKNAIPSSVGGLPIPTKPGHNFAGWYAKQNFDVTSVISNYTKIEKHTTLYARWTAATATDARIDVTAKNITNAYKAYKNSSSEYAQYMPNVFDSSFGSYWGGWTGETEMVIDLGKTYRISQIEMYLNGINGGASKDGISIYGKTDSSAYKLIYSFGDPAKVTDVKDILLSNNTVFAARYIKVVRQQASFIGEIRFYGKETPTSGFSLNAVSNLGASWDTTVATDPGMKLTWTGPSISGFDKPADSYEVRYSKSPINESNWDNATLLTEENFISGDAGIPVPKIGDSQSVMIYDLNPETTYYFAIKSIVNWNTIVKSGISNIATAATGKDTVAPSSINDFKIALTGSSKISVTLTATGDNNNRGKASAYKAYFSTTDPASAADFATWRASATQGTGMPAPQSSGKAEEFRIAGFSANKKYYAVITAIDKGGNESAESNVITFTTKNTDTTAPGGILDLEASYASGIGVLTWTAPGSDGFGGDPAYKYHVKFLATTAQGLSVNDANWNSASFLETVHKPSSVGLTETINIDDLKAGNFYYYAVKTEDVDGNISVISNSMYFAVGSKIDFGKWDMIPEFDNGFHTLIDEQGFADPGNPQADPATFSQPVTAQKIQYYNLIKDCDDEGIVFDFRGEHYITEIWAYVGGGSGYLEIYTGTPFSSDWDEPDMVWDLSGFNKWVSIPVNMATRYIRIQGSNELGRKFPVEILFYGIQTGKRETHTRTQLASVKTTTIDKTIGTNIFINDFVDNLCLFENLREYHNWRWDSGLVGNTWPEPKYTYSPSAAGPGGWWFDVFYKRFKDNGQLVMPCYQGGQSDGFGYAVLDDSVSGHMAPYGADWADPKSYEMHGDFMYQMAAVFGSKTIDDSLLHLASNQKRVTGLNLIDMIENGNENDKTWRARNGYVNGYEAACQASVDYDGHESKVSKTVGVKNADPDMEFSNFGRAGAQTGYYLAMNLWFQYNRSDKKFTSDYINNHMYTNTNENSDAQTGGTVEQHGIAYEYCDIWYLRINDLIEFRDTFVPTAKLIMSEIGWDTHPSSPQAAIEIGTLTGRVVQASWLMRAFMMYEQYGFEYTQQYMQRDTGPEGSSSGRYNTSGVVTWGARDSKDYAPVRKESWYYLYTMKTALKGMNFSRVINTGDSELWCYEFVNKKTGQVAYALWYSTMVDKRINDYKLKIPGNQRVFTQVNAVHQNPVGLQKEVFVNNEGYLTVDWITETPVFLVEGFSTNYSAPEWNKDDKVQITVLDTVDPLYAADSTNDLTTVRLTWPEPYSEYPLAYYSIYVDDWKTDSIPAAQKYYDLTIPTKSYADIELICGNIYGQVSTDRIKGESPVDITAPTKPRNPVAFGITDTEVSIRWDEASDNRNLVGNMSYMVYNGEEVLSKGTTAALTVSDLKPNTEYSFNVVAIDLAGNISDKTNTVKVTTGTKSGLSWPLLITTIVLAAGLLGIGGFLGIRKILAVKAAKAALVAEGAIEGADVADATGEIADADLPDADDIK